MKTLLQINAACNYGSTGRIAENIGLLAQNQGWKCYIAHGTRYVKQTQLCDICTETSWGERMHALRSFLLDEHGLGSKQATLLLIRKIQQISPDIIHLHNIHGYYLNYPLLFNFLSTTNIPIVWTLHDCWPITGHCTYFNRIHCDKWKTYCDKCPQLKAYPKSLIRDNSANNYSLKRELFLSVKQHLHLIPVSDCLMNILNHSFLNDVPMTRIHNGVDLTIFTPQIQVDPKKKSFTILGVASSWGMRKGYDDFIKLRKLLPDSYSIMMIGLAKDQIRNLPNGIIGIERTDSIAQLAALYSSANVFFNPTWEDNFPTTNIEALACGTPVITYRTGGSIEAISEDTGFVVEQGDLHAAIDLMNVIKNNGKDFYTMKCRERATKYFNKDISFQRYIDLYNKLIDKQ